MSTAERTILDDAEQDMAEFLSVMGLTEMPAAGSPDMDVAIDRALEQIAEARREIAKNDAVAERRKQMIEDWRQEVNVTHENRIVWATRMVQSLASAYDFGKKRSRSLPAGTFGFRKSPDRLVVNDMDAALAFAKRTSQLAGEIKVTESIPSTPLKQWAQSTGEVPDGCELVGGEDAFFVKPRD